MTPNLDIKPDIEISVNQSFGIETDMLVDGFSKKNEYVPEIDKDYKFDRDTTLAILSGFAFNKRVLIQGYHGTGKSTHIEQVAARLNWPCIRVNLDSHISRIDLIGKDAIKIKDNKQITEFKEGMLPWSIQNPVALVFDEYDAGRPDVMFVIQRILESDRFGDDADFLSLPLRTIKPDTNKTDETEEERELIKKVLERAKSKIFKHLYSANCRCFKNVFIRKRNSYI